VLPIHSAKANTTTVSRPQNASEYINQGPEMSSRNIGTGPNGSPLDASSEQEISFWNREGLSQTKGEVADSACSWAPALAQKVYHKRPIPRLHKAVSRPKGRVCHACVPCSLVKAKCTGESPECQRCGSLQKECWYRHLNHDPKQR
jgi:hypothetical protein